MTTCIIIEDEYNSGVSLGDVVKNHFSGELQLIGTASCLSDGVNLIRQKSPGLVFLDIDLPDENGLSIYTWFPSPEFDVIFISSVPDYAIQAIKQMAIDYLVKPVSLIEMKAAMVRLEKRKKGELKKSIPDVKTGTPFREKIALPTSDGFQIIPFNEILYCQASENYSYIYTTSGESILISRPLKTMEEMLPSCFFRIHKSILLNINYVKSFSRKEGFVVTLETGQKFEIATRRHEEFVNQFIRKHPPMEIENSPVFKR